jgi:hypothetical protein
MGMNFRYRFRLAAASAALFCLGGLTEEGASAQDAGSSTKSFLSYFGLQSGSDGSIDYRSRPPIVVPPRFDLPKPKEAARDSSWPQDPDIAAERRAALDSHTPVAQTPENARNGTSQTQSQEGQGAVPAEGPPDECETNSGTALCLSSTLKSLKSVTNVFHPETAQLGPEPARKYLTDPPSGYRRPTGDGKVGGESNKKKRDPAAHDAIHLPGTDMF